MKLVQCKFSGCSAEIPWTGKYCSEHNVIKLVCGVCGIVFERHRVINEGIIKNALKKTYFPSCSRRCASKRSRERIETNPYEHKNKPIEPLLLNFDEADRQQRKYKKPLSMRHFFDPANNMKLYNIKSLKEKTLLLTVQEIKDIKERMNDPEYKQKARWLSPKEFFFDK